MKKIAIFSGYSLPHLGGVENYTKNLENELLKNGYSIINVSSNYEFSNKYKFFSDKCIINYLLPVKKIFISRYPIIKKNKIYKDIINELNNNKIDAIIVNTRFYLTSLVGAKYGKNHNIPVFLIEHGSQHLTVNNRVLDFLGAIYEHCLTTYIEKYVDYNFGVSKAACVWQKHFGINSDGVWYNSINDFSINTQKCTVKSKIQLLYAGRIIKQKGIIELLSTFEKLCGKYSNIYLTIAGDGELLYELKEKYKNNSKIFFTGKLDFEDLKQWYLKTDIFVYAPIWPEGLPTSILEAGLMKCAVVSSPQGGIKEIIENNKNGLLVNNMAELESALICLISNYDLRKKLSSNLEEEVRKKFLWSVTSKKAIADIEKRI
jgi:glycosyltransferase involved in cell wall biosynthesis